MAGFRAAGRVVSLRSVWFNERGYGGEQTLVYRTRGERGLSPCASFCSGLPPVLESGQFGSQAGSQSWFPKHYSKRQYSYSLWFFWNRVGESEHSGSASLQWDIMGGRDKSHCELERVLGFLERGGYSDAQYRTCADCLGAVLGRRASRVAWLQC